MEVRNANSQARPRNCTFRTGRETECFFGQMPIGIDRKLIAEGTEYGQVCEGHMSLDPGGPEIFQNAYEVNTCHNETGYLAFFTIVKVNWVF